MKRKFNHYLIIDGYNIINAWEELRRISVEDLDASREKLIDIIIEYAEFSGQKAIVVFDAYNVKSSMEKIENRKYITVVYTKEHQTADSYIEKYITSLFKYDVVKV
ncbi:MAG: NYN domain-containing protein, partial [Peptostreptococcaceae bacterium]|nr:NYN domain-containing protein [Peptostreptococcaceae bacterium]